MTGSEISGPILPTSSAGDHLRPDEDQQHRECGLEVVQALDQVGDQEEQRPQAQQRERVGGEHDVGVVR